MTSYFGSHERSLMATCYYKDIGLQVVIRLINRISGLKQVLLQVSSVDIDCPSKFSGRV